MNWNVKTKNCGMTLLCCTQEQRNDHLRNQRPNWAIWSYRLELTSQQLALVLTRKHTLPPTLCQIGLSSVPSPWSPDGLCEAAMLEVTGARAAHCSTDMLALLFLHSGEHSVSSTLWVGKLKRSLASHFQVRINALRNSFFRKYLKLSKVSFLPRA